MRTYRRPPITEAVLEFRFATPINSDQLKRLNSKFSKKYPFSEESNEIKLHFDFNSGSSKSERGSVQFKLTNLNQDNIVIIAQNIFTTSRLAPYDGWDSLIQRARDGWEIIRSNCGYREITRIGLRYINRLDIPRNETGVLHEEDYINVGPRTPPNSPPMLGFTNQVAMPVGNGRGEAVINSALVPPALIDHISIVIDLDVSCTQAIPRNEDLMWSLVADMRRWKNELFESCVTDKARELFDR